MFPAMSGLTGSGTHIFLSWVVRSMHARVPEVTYVQILSILLATTITSHLHH